MSLKDRIKTLERTSVKPVDVVSILIAGRNAARTGEPLPRTPSPPEFEHSRSPLARAIFAARRRVGLNQETTP